MEYEVQIPLDLTNESSMPEYGTEKAAGADVKACIEDEVVIEPGQTALIPTGIKMEIPDGFEVQVRPRSGLALKHGITVLNTPGTIDSDYRGEVGVILINHSSKPFIVTPGMKVAQIVLAQAIRASFIDAKDALSVTSRGEGGFGHTGLH